MNIKQALTIIAFLVIAQGSRGQTLLRDDFNDGTLDTNVWEVLTPLGDSQMTEVGGNAVFFQRGVLVSKQPIPTAVEVTGRLAFTGNTHDIFVLMLRSDGNLLPPHQQFYNGVYVQFAMRGGDDGDKSGQQNIYLNTGDGQAVNLGVADFLFQPGNYYDFKVVDDGYHVAIFLQDMTTPLLSGNTSYAPGDKLGMQNRGFVPWWPIYDNKTELDYIQIVPEPTSIALIVFGLAPFIWSRRARGSGNPPPYPLTPQRRSPF